jgi:hypothetical protein
VYENMVLRRIYERNRKEMSGYWRRFHYEQLLNFYASPDIIRVIKSRTMRCKRYVARIGEMRKAYSILAGKSERKRPLGRPRLRREYDNRFDRREI